MNTHSLKLPSRAIIGSPQRRTADNRGFALVVTLSLLILLAAIAVGLLSLSSISLQAAVFRKRPLYLMAGNQKQRKPTRCLCLVGLRREPEGPSARAL